MLQDKYLRIFVLPKEEYCQDGRLCEELNSEFGLNISKVRVANRYDIWGTDDIDGVRQFLIQAPLEEFFLNELPSNMLAQFSNTLVVQRASGMYDSRVDATEQGIQIALATKTKVHCAKVFLFDGLQDEDLEKVTKYLVNPLENSVGDNNVPEFLQTENIIAEPEVVVHGFCKMDTNELREVCSACGLGMSIDDMREVQLYFAKENRDPNEIELKILDTYWSDHCRHTTFNTRLVNQKKQASAIDNKYTRLVEKALQQHSDNVEFVYGKGHNRPLTLMQVATISSKVAQKKGLLNDLDVSDEINACSFVVPIELDNGQVEDYLIQFKNETHNHPTEIEPNGGAATCLGGAIRDPLAGRAYVYQAMRVTGSGDPRQRVQDTMQGKLPQKTITKDAAEGFSGYGNQIGLATGEVKEYYHDGYAAKRMEVGAVIGCVKSSVVRREKPKKGDVVLLVGADTGIDGVGGATGSSKEHDKNSKQNCSTQVQKGNPVEGRKLQRVFLRQDFVQLIKKCNDFGAGGVSVAVGELCDSLCIDLDKIPTKYNGMSSTELALSESQERMAIVVDSCDVQKVEEICKSENIKCTVIASVQDNGYLTMKNNGNTVVNLKREFLEKAGAKRTASFAVQAPLSVYKSNLATVNKDKDYAKLFQTVLSNLSVCCQQELSEKFDSTVGAGTVLMPYGGLYQLSPVQGMAALIPAKGNSKTATVMTHGFDPHLSDWSQYHGGHYAVAIAVAKAVAMGVDYSTMKFSLQEYFEKMTNSASWGKPLSALLGATTTLEELGLAAIGGKDSMSGSFYNLTVPPTLIAFGVGIANAKNIVSPEFKNDGGRVYLLKLPQDGDDCIDLNALKECYSKLHNQINAGSICSSFALNCGGIAEAVAKCCFGNAKGFAFCTELDIQTHYGDIIVEVNDSFVWQDIDGVECIEIGQINNSSQITFANDSSTCIHLDVALSWHTNPLAGVFGKCDVDKLLTNQINSLDNHCVSQMHALHNENQNNKVYTPNVAIAIFPGTNGELDMKNAWELVGCKTESVLISNKTDLQASIDRLSKAIDNSDVFAIPGGFSFGDEPDGSAKSIVAVLRNNKIKKSIEDLLGRKGLILGICNGFQALIKSGLIAYDKICELEQDDVTLAHNKIGRHISRYAYTKISHTQSPWNVYADKDEVFAVPLSHGEGRIVGSPQKLQEFVDNDRIFSKYVDCHGQEESNYPYNPNGSSLNIEGLLSPSKQVLGKMGHSERVPHNSVVGKNIPVYKDIKLFHSAVAWLRKNRM